MKISFPLLCACASVLTLSACAGGKAKAVDSHAPMTMPTVNAVSPPLTPEQQAGMYARLARLEQDVSGIKSQMTQVGPILEKMPALQDKLSELVTELQKIDARVAAAQGQIQNLPTPVVATPAPAPVKPYERAMPPPVTSVPEPVAKPAAPKGLVAVPVTAAPTPAAKPATRKVIPEKAAAPAPAAKADPAPAAQHNGQAAVRQIRVGDDADKTRVVLDLSRKVPFIYDLDNAEKILIVDIDAPEFAAAAGASFAKSPLVASYTAQAVAGGKSRVIFQLRAPVDILRSQSLPPNADKGDRIVLDLGPARP